MAEPRSARRRGRGLRDVLPGQQDASARQGEAIRQQTEDGERRHALAATGFTDEGDGASRLDGEGQPLQHGHGASGPGQGDGEILDREDGRRLVLVHAQLRLRRRGLTASLKASPTRLTPSTARKIAAPGSSTVHHASRA